MCWSHHPRRRPHTDATHKRRLLVNPRRKETNKWIQRLQCMRGQGGWRWRHCTADKALGKMMMRDDENWINVLLNQVESQVFKFYSLNSPFVFSCTAHSTFTMSSVFLSAVNITFPMLLASMAMYSTPSSLYSQRWSLPAAGFGRVRHIFIRPHVYKGMSENERGDEMKLVRSSIYSRL